MEKEKQTIEIIEPVKVEAKPLPTKDELRERGFTAPELESAEKRGMIAKEKSDEKKEEGKEVLKSDETIKTDESKEKSEKEATEKSEREKFKHSEQFKDADLTPEQEAELVKLFPHADGKMNSVQALYWRMKNERKARQKAQLEKKSLEDQLNALRSAKPAQVKEPELDENGNEIDPEEKPLTEKRLKELREQEEKVAQEKQDAIRQKGIAVAESLRDQEDYAKSVYPDFENTVNLAKDLMQNLDEYIPDTKTRNRIVSLVRDLQIKAASADEMSLEDFNAADISYEIGKLHPEYGKKKEVLDPKANGSLKADKVKRVEEATQRRGSSAGLNGGGGRRTVSPDEVTREDVSKMDYNQRAVFKKNHPDRYKELVWG